MMGVVLCGFVCWGLKSLHHFLGFDGTLGSIRLEWTLRSIPGVYGLGSSQHIHSKSLDIGPIAQEIRQW